MAEDARLVEIERRELEHDPLVRGEGGSGFSERLGKVGEDQFPVWQFHAVEDRVEELDDSTDGVDGGIWHGGREDHPGTASRTSPPGGNFRWIPGR